MLEKDTDGKAKSEDPDQTAPKEQSDLDLHCLPVSPNIYNVTDITMQSNIRCLVIRTHRVRRTI